MAASKAPKSTAGGWHTDGAVLSVLINSPVNEEWEETHQSFFVAERSGVVEGGITAVRLMPEDPATPLGEGPIENRLVETFEAQENDLATFVPVKRNKKTGILLIYNHSAMPVKLKPGTHRDIVFASISIPKNEPREKPEWAFVKQGVDETRDSKSRPK